MNSNENDNNKPLDTNEPPPEFMHHWHGGRHRIKIPFIIAIVVAIKGALIYGIWNHLMPDLFHAPTLTYCQAIGLLILAKLFVGFGFRGHMHGGHMHGHGGHDRHDRWKRKMWNRMSPEQREKIKSKIDKWCDR